MESNLVKDYLGEAYIVDAFWSNSAMSAKYSEMFKDGKVANGLAPSPYRWIRKNRRKKGGKDESSVAQSRSAD